VGDLPVWRESWKASYYFSLYHEKEIREKVGSIRFASYATTFHSFYASILEGIKFTPILL
jgi:hypothetical protein